MDREQNPSRPEIDLIERLEASAQWLAGFELKAERAAESLFRGEPQCCAPLFAQIMEELDGFIDLLDRTKSRAKAMGALLERYRSGFAERVERIGRHRRAGEFEAVAEILQFDLVPLFASWNVLRDATLQDLRRRGKTNAA